MIVHGGKSRQVIEKFGGASRARTDDLIVANDALSQLSYSPTKWRLTTTVDFTSGARVSTIRVQNPGSVRWQAETARCDAL
jgi:hypothetical protein